MGAGCIGRGAGCTGADGIGRDGTGFGCIGLGGVIAGGGMPGRGIYPGRTVSAGERTLPGISVEPVGAAPRTVFAFGDPYTTPTGTPT
jgi:hypothetical protein